MSPVCCLPGACATPFAWCGPRFPQRAYPDGSARLAYPLPLSPPPTTPLPFMPHEPAVPLLLSVSINSPPPLPTGRVVGTVIARLATEDAKERSVLDRVCARLFRNLSFLAEGRLRCVEEGVITVLSSLITSPVEEVRAGGPGGCWGTLGACLGLARACVCVLCVVTQALRVGGEGALVVGSVQRLVAC